MRLILLVFALAVGSVGGENLNGIYLGNDVTEASLSRQDVAVWIAPSGIVTVWIGATVPDLHDAQGHTVKIKSVQTKRR